MHRWIIAAIVSTFISALSTKTNAGVQVIPLGQEVHGEITPETSPAGWRFEGLEGTKVQLSVTGKNGLRPLVRIWDEETLQVLAEADAGKKKKKKKKKKAKAVIGKLVLPRTGPYFVEVTGMDDGPTGTFRGQSSGKLPSSLKNILVKKKTGGDPSIGFDALAGMRLSGWVTAHGVVPAGAWLMLEGPEQAVALATAGEVSYEKQGKKAVLKNVVLSETGLHLLTSALSVPLSASLTLMPANTAGKVSIEPGPTLLLLPPPKLDPHVASTVDAGVLLEGSAPGADMVELLGPAAMLTVPVEAGHFSAVVPLKPDVVNHLYLTARSDDVVDSAPSSTQVTMDTQPPKLNVLFPADGAEPTDATVVVGGQVGDSLSGHLGLTVSVNGVEAAVNAGFGTNGTFEAAGIPLNDEGPTALLVTATDAFGNVTNASLEVTKTPIDPDQPLLQALAGDGQSGLVTSKLKQPLEVRLLLPDGSPLAGKIVTFTVARSDGRLASTKGGTPHATSLLIETDADGRARAWWRLGADAGIGNNRVEATSKGVQGVVTFCATADPDLASAIHVSTGSHQVAQAGAPLPLPLIARITDGVNPVSDVKVTFKVVEGGGGFDGEKKFVISTDSAGQAMATLTLGPSDGPQVVEADFSGNVAQPARFVARALASKPGAATRFSSRVVDNAGLPIGGARCALKVNGLSLTETLTDVEGAFAFDDIGIAGPGDLIVDGRLATLLDGQGIPQNSFPTLHFEDFLVVAGAENEFMTVKLPRLDPANQALYDSTKDVELTCEGIAGLRFVVKVGSMTMPDGITKPSPGNPVWLSLDQVHFDEIPMPLPDGRTTRFAATLQPGGATFDPPVYFEMPNMSGMAPGAITSLFSFNHATGRFEIVGTGSVSADGALITSDPGSGLPVAGWHGNAPPPPPTGDGSNACPSGGSSTGPEEQAEDEKKQCSPCGKDVPDAKDVAKKAAALLASASKKVDAAESQITNAWLSAAALATSLIALVATYAVIMGALSGCAATGFFTVPCLVALIVALVALATDILAITVSAKKLDASLDKTSVQLVSAAKDVSSALTCLNAPFVICTEKPNLDALLKKALELGTAISEQNGRLSSAENVIGTVVSNSDALKAQIDAAIAKIEQIKCNIDPNCGGSSFAEGEDPFEQFLALEAALKSAAPEYDALAQLGADLESVLSEAAIAAAPMTKAAARVATLASDDGIMVTLGDASAPMDLYGEFVVSGVIAGDDLVAPRAEIDLGDETIYLKGGYGKIYADQVAVFGDFEASAVPFPTPVSLHHDDEGLTLLVELGMTANLAVTGAMSDGANVPLNDASVGTWYTSTNPAIVSVDGHGVAIGVSIGTAFVTASNEGVSTVKRIDVVASTIEAQASGFVFFGDGSPAAGALVTSLYGGETTTANDGSFQLSESVPGDADAMVLKAEFDDGEQVEIGYGLASPLVPGQIADAGIILLGDDGASNVALGRPVSLISGASYGKAPSSLVDGAFVGKGTGWQSGTSYWWGGSSVFEIDLEGAAVLTAAIVQGDDNDAYRLDYRDAITGEWVVLWNVPNYDNFGFGMQTRPDPSNHSKQYVLPAAVAADAIRARAVSGDGNYSLSEIQVYGWTTGQ